MTADVSFQVIPDGALSGHDEPQEGEVIESDVPSEPQPGDAFADLEADGIRLGGIGDVSIRDGSGNVVVLLVAE